MATIAVMTVPKKLQVPLTSEERAALDAMMEALPALEEPGRLAEFGRALIRLGMLIYAENPSLRVYRCPPPAQLVTAIREALAREPGMRATIARMAAAVTVDPMTPDELRSAPVTEHDPSKETLENSRAIIQREREAAQREAEREKKGSGRRKR